MRIRNHIWIIVLILIVITIPFLYGSINSGSDYVFGGFLLNPIDGNSYLAKMHEGWEGSWSFSLPYTPVQGNGVFLFIFYLFLGHLSRWINLPLIIVFHLTRLICSIFFLSMLWRFINFHIKDSKVAFSVFILSGLGSGLGWIASIFGMLPMDFWVAEAYPFLSIFSNPHFPLSLGLILAGYIIIKNSFQKMRRLFLFLIGFLLAVILPFGFVILGILLLIEYVISWKDHVKNQWIDLISFSVGGFPVLFYQFGIINTDPQLIVWNIQNQTPAPQPINLILSLSPALIFALLYIYRKKNIKSDQSTLSLIVWMVAGIFLTYLPFNLQRRFLLGIFIPVSILAMKYLSELVDKQKNRLLVGVLISFSLISNLIMIISGFVGMKSFQPILYITKSEYEGLKWISSKANTDDLVLSTSRMGLFLPAYTGRRVIYGHPFETVNASINEKIVNEFFSCSLTREDEEEIVRNFEVDYIFWSSRNSSEECLPRLLEESSPITTLVYPSGITKIYEIH
jgi:hypothetical protein